MAAGEDQSQPVVFHAVVVQLRLGGDTRAKPIGHRCEGGIESGAAADVVNRLEATGRNEPSPWVGGHAIDRPALHRSGEGFLQRLLGEIEVAEEADERRQNAPGLGAVDGLDRLAYGRGGSQIGRTSIEPQRTEGIRAATVIASFRSLASIR